MESLIKQYRKENNLSLKQMTKILNDKLNLSKSDEPKINKSTIYRWEEGQRLLKNEKVKIAFCEILNVSYQKFNCSLIKNYYKLKEGQIEWV